MEGCPPPQAHQKGFSASRAPWSERPLPGAMQEMGWKQRGKEGDLLPGGSSADSPTGGDLVGCWEPTEDAKLPDGTSWVKDVRGQVRDVLHPTLRAWLGHGPRLGCSMAQDAPWPGMLHSLGSSVTRDVP